MCQLWKMQPCHSVGIPHRISESSDSSDITWGECTSTSVDELWGNSAQNGDSKLENISSSELSLDVSQSRKIWNTDLVGGWVKSLSSSELSEPEAKVITVHHASEHTPHVEVVARHADQAHPEHTHHVHRQSELHLQPCCEVQRQAQHFAWPTAHIGIWVVPLLISDASPADRALACVPHGWFLSVPPNVLQQTFCSLYKGKAAWQTSDCNTIHFVASHLFSFTTCSCFLGGSEWSHSWSIISLSQVSSLEVPSMLLSTSSPSPKSTSHSICGVTDKSNKYSIEDRQTIKRMNETLCVKQHQNFWFCPRTLSVSIEDRQTIKRMNETFSAIVRHYFFSIPSIQIAFVCLYLCVTDALQ